MTRRPASASDVRILKVCQELKEAERGECFGSNHAQVVVVGWLVVCLFVCLLLLLLVGEVGEVGEVVYEVLVMVNPLLPAMHFPLFFPMFWRRSGRSKDPPRLRTPLAS